MSQPESALENQLIAALSNQGYERITITSEKELIANLKTKIEKHNNIVLTDKEFVQVLNHLNKGNVWDRAKILRDKMQLTKEDGKTAYIEFINQDAWCQNQYQVTNQITVEGNYKNRYDVTILINGLPLCQIELKRRGSELKEAFNQVNRYHRHSYGASYGLFQYIQIFVISNGANTKYYSNNAKQTSKQTFYWTDKENKRISDLFAFTEIFLEKCHLSKMIAKYTVLAEKNKTLMILRPYQYYAAEAIYDRVKNTNKNGYIWHTTGSGKTLTSFKASQILMTLPNVYKVVFVVDRKDLDDQTTKEFNSFSEGSVDGTDNTAKLVTQFGDDTKLIVTTIQKLNSAISKRHHLTKMEKQKDKKIVFIFDECHRTQFGETHARIKAFFTNNQMFGFTGTPIFEKNASSMDGRKRTTKELFEECLHKYVITNAINDENVLKFSVEYVGRYKQKNTSTELDINVEGIDTKELLESPERIDKITDFIIANYDRKTHTRAFNAMFCVSSIETLTKYYDNFAKKKAEGKHNLRIATVFSFTANEEDKDANGTIEPDDLNTEGPINVHSRDKLEQYIGDYNAMYNTAHSTKDSFAFDKYYKDISNRVKNKEADILLVVSMFLTGFDSPNLNTIFVDKNLKYHGLIQAFSRTNRTLGEKKSHGNVVCFRNLKAATDEAITLFSNKDAIEDIILKPYTEYTKKFNKAYQELLAIAPTIDSVDELPSEIEQLAFVEKFRELIRTMNTLKTFADFKIEDLAIPEQDFENFKSKYLDLHDKVKRSGSKENVSILNDVDFELELIHRDEINVAYILALLAKLNQGTEAQKAKKKREIEELLDGQVQLRSKRTLIEKFIEENLTTITDLTTVEAEFEKFWTIEKERAMITLSQEEQLDTEKLKGIISEYLFSHRLPMRQEIDQMLNTKPKLNERTTTFTRIKERIESFIETFVEGI
jgi:type I restriction enzyme, R subunit